MQVLIGDNNSDTPTPESGNGYLRLKYNSGSVLANIRTITRLETPVLYGIEGQQYALSFLCRKHSSDSNSKEILSIMIDCGCNGNWEPLFEQAVSNLSTWETIEISFSAIGFYKLGIVGSLEYGSSFFIDDMKVFRTTDTDIHSMQIKQKDSNKRYYSILGRKVETMQKGINVVKNSDGSTTKIITK